MRAERLGRLVKPEIQIKFATLKDYAGFRDLAIMAIKIHHDAMPGIFTRPDKAAPRLSYFKSVLRRHDQAIFLAKSNGKTIGFIHLRAGRDLVPVMVPGKYAHVGDIVVDKPWQRKGVGRLLMKSAEAWARSIGAGHIRLNVWEFNWKAKKFYSRLGFTQTTVTMRKKVRA